MAITQLSVFLMNQPGALIEAIQALSDANINIRAMSIAEANEECIKVSRWNSKNCSVKHRVNIVWATFKATQIKP